MPIGFYEVLATIYMEQEIIIKNVKNVIEEKPITIKMIKDSWFAIIFFGFLPAVVGSYNYVTFPMFIVVVISMIVWGNLIIKHNQINKFILYSGIGLMIVSLECLISVYKIFAIIKLSTFENLLITVIYVAFIIMYSLGYRQKFYQENVKKKKNAKPLIIVTPLMGILIGKSLIGVLNNAQAFLLLALISLILSLIFGMGVKFLINYYYIRKYKIM